MLDIWLIPVFAVFVIVLFGLYLMMRFRGGTCQRTDGKTVLHKHVPEEDMPPS
jgi:hypothetical protein